MIIKKTFSTDYCDWNDLPDSDSANVSVEIANDFGVEFRDISPQVQVL